jgi:hypothetical protein
MLNYQIIKKSLILCLTLNMLGGIFTLVLAQAIPYAGERLVVVTDGNEHGKDDWAATPLTLALIASKEIQDQVMVYAFSSHTWGSNKTHPGADAQMRESAFLGSNQFRFKKTKFIESVTAPNFAIIEITELINKSSAKNPLTILASGPLEIIGTSLNEADSTKLKFVRVISYSTWDQEHANSPTEGETHTGWTWEKLRESFQGNQLQLVSLVNETNGKDGLKAPLTAYAWLKDAPNKEPKAYEKGSWAWLYSRLEASKNGNEVNPNDARLIYYLLTGNPNPKVNDIQEMLANPSKWN